MHEGRSGSPANQGSADKEFILLLRGVVDSLSATLLPVGEELLFFALLLLFPFFFFRSVHGAVCLGEGIVNNDGNLLLDQLFNGLDVLIFFGFAYGDGGSRFTCPS